MKDRSRHKSSIGFTDLLFNLLIGFVYLFMIAFILINPVAKNSDVPSKAEWLLVMEWDPELNDDIDIWVKDPAGNLINFNAREGGLMHLERDDLGHSSDVIEFVESQRSGKPIKKTIMINREVVTLRGTVPGEYKVMAQVYSRNYPIDQIEAGERPINTNGWIEFTLIKVNPYIETVVDKFTYNERGQQITLVNFTLDDNGDFVSSDKVRHEIITRPRHFSHQRRN